MDLLHNKIFKLPFALEGQYLMIRYVLHHKRGFFQQFWQSMWSEIFYFLC